VHSDVPGTLVNILEYRKFKSLGMLNHVGYSNRFLDLQDEDTVAVFQPIRRNIPEELNFLQRRC